MIVCIAEKPSVAKDIAKVLGANTPHDGYMEGNGYQVTWTFGHLCTLKEPHDYTPLWKSWELAFLPMIPDRFGIKLIPGNKTYQHQFDIIARLMQSADSIVNCGDAGQEGELIQRWVMQKAKATCPVQRLWISSLTEQAIREGFSNLHPQSDYQSLYEAGLCRAIGDWLLGMNASRLYTLKYGQGRQVLTIGRVQTPTLALIVNRQHEIDNFQPQQYWVLATRYRDTLFSVVDGKSDKGKQRTQEEWQQILDSIADKDFYITDIQAKKGTEAPPRLYDLTSLQVDCNRKFGFSADQTLQLIQSLYEKKVTTYPRVDTTFLTDDIYARCPQILQGLLPYGPIIQPLMGKKLPKSKKVFDNSKVTDHHAIIPTGVNPANGDLTFNEKKVFDLVARHFIAVFYPDCKFLTTTVLGSVEKVDFKTTGKQIEEPGWHAVFDWGKSKQEQPADDEEQKEENQVLPHFDKGEHGPHQPSLTEKWTTPPKPYTEATLLRAMETAGKLVDNEELRDALKANGIGRPSTRAAIIENLFRRSYIIKKGKTLVPTPTGIDLIGIIREELLKSVELTGQWEKKLREIESHNYNAQQFIVELKQMVWQLVQQVLADTSNRRVTATQPQPAKSPKTKSTPKSSSKSNPTPNNPQ